MSSASALTSSPELDLAKRLVESALDRYSAIEAGCPAGLGEAIRYSLLAPGKRLRPMLVLMAAHANGAEMESALPAACAVEMIHAYSLIHDDLPAMDDDDLRRGRPTNHVVYGEANAILAGDSLQARAFELLATELQPATIAVSCLATLGHAAGACQLVGGQFDDLACESQPGSREELEAIHRRKTGALLLASVKMGGLIGQADSERLQALERFGRNLGLAFQITDDLLDLRGDEQDLGKRTGKDEGRGKLTYPGLIGVAQSEQQARDLIADACAAVEPFGSRGQGLQLIARFVLERNR